MKKSAGILLYRFKHGQPEFFLVHPGGPFFVNKDLGCWSIPKGLFEHEMPLVAAKREFFEETGHQITGDFIELTPIVQKNGKHVYAFAIESDFEETTLKSNTFNLNGTAYPEIDRGAWFTKNEALQKLTPGQDNLILELVDKLKALQISQS